MKIKIISGLYKGRFIKTPPSTTTRPTSSMLREAFFNIVQNSVEGITFLDLFAGSGAIGIEALSRGAKRSYFVEKEKQAFSIIKENIVTLGITDLTEVFFMDVKKALSLFRRKNLKFDLIYCDPPYKLAPNIVFDLLIDAQTLLDDSGRLFLEYGQKLVDCPLEIISERNFSDSYLYEFSS